MIVTLLASLTVQSADLPTDPARLSVLMQQSCRIQQVDRQGGAEPDHFAFCQCLDGELAQSLTPGAYRAAALGGQGAIQGRGEIADWEAARLESQQVFASLPEGEQAGLGGHIQSALGVCLGG